MDAQNGRTQLKQAIIIMFVKSKMKISIVTTNFYNNLNLKTHFIKRLRFKIFKLEL